MSLAPEVDRTAFLGFHSVPTAIVVIGVGTVGAVAVQRLLDDVEGSAAAVGELVAVVNSTGAYPVDASCDSADQVLARAGRRVNALPLEQVLAKFVAQGRTIALVDATASDDIAAEHVRWLRQGFHVVTANKVAAAGNSEVWEQLQEFVQVDAKVRYRHSATVGAGLPAVTSVARIAATEPVFKVEGVLSGSLAWLLDQYEPGTRFSEVVAQAVEGGICEPDPMIDLSGVDVLRKAVILARAAGLTVAPDQVTRTPLVPDDVVDVAAYDADFDQWWQGHAAPGQQIVFRALVEVVDGTAQVSVGPIALPYGDPLTVHGPDNVIRVFSRRYPDRPLTLAGPGAGAEVTAAALLDDLATLGA